MTQAVLFHTQHLLGIGHTRRAALLVGAMLNRGLRVTVLSGGEPAEVDWGKAELIELPWARARGGDFAALVDADDRPLDAAFHEHRRRLVVEAFERIRPAVLVLESFPFGRRAFRTELAALIAAARAATPRTAVLTSLRDILVARPDPAWALSVAEVVRRDIDAVLVHGDPALVPLEASFGAAPQIADRLHYTGYVAPNAPSDNLRDGGNGGEVVVSAGGGAVGLALLRGALAARPFTGSARRPWRLIAGLNLPEADYQGLARDLPPDVVLERFRRDFPELLRRCHLSISQAGYNTIMDLLQTGPRALVVPFAAGGESEQALRARLLAERGILQVFPESSLDQPKLLAVAIDQASAMPRPPLPGFALAGAQRSAALVAGFARRSMGA